MPLKYACIFVLKKSGFLKVNDKSGIQHGNLPRETKISQSYPSILKK